jgi:hypothetical protein
MLEAMLACRPHVTPGTSHGGNRIPSFMQFFAPFASFAPLR